MARAAIVQSVSRRRPPPPPPPRPASPWRGFQTQPVADRSTPYTTKSRTQSNASQEGCRLCPEFQ
eukprot:6199921-Pleurochrysis_carterae.AAC.1